MAIIEDDYFNLIATLEAVAQKYFEEWEQCKQDEKKMIERAVRDHTSLPEHYWEPRYKAEQHFKAAHRIAQALKE